METTPQPTRPAWEHRLQAVLALLGGEPVPHVTARFGMGRSILYKWRHRALTALQGALTDHRPGPQCPANRLSPAEEAAPGGAGPAPSDLECGADPGQGRPGGAVAPHHPTPAPPLRAAAPAQTARPLSARPAPHAEGEAGSPPPHRGEAVAGPGTPGLGTPERGADADQSRDHQADETRQAAGPDATPAAAHSGASTPAITPIVSGMATAWRKSLTRRPGGNSIR